MAQISNCLKLISKLDERDQDALVARLDELQAQGVPAERAQIQAAIDVLTAAKGENYGLDQAPALTSKARAAIKSGVTETPEFKRWSGGAPVVRLGESYDFKSGQPVVVESLHGTTNADLVSFDRERANIEGDWGAGFYSSNNPEDVANNYANNEGRDLTNRIELTAERLAPDFDDDMDAARAEARARLTQERPNTMKLFVRFENPAVLGGDAETFLDYSEEYNEELDEYEEPSGALVSFVEALRDAAGGFNVDGGLDEFTDGIFSQAMDNGGVKLSDVRWQMNNTPVYAYNDKGDTAIHELVRLALQGAGFDGVIDTAVSSKFGSMKGVDAGTVHFIAFEPTQLKSATGNGGAFDPANPDITRSAARAPAGVEIVEVDDGFDAMKDGKRIGRLRDNLPRGAAEQLDESASVDIVKVDPEFKGKGVGSALYDAFNEKHGGRIAPSGKTSPEAWALWKRKFPEKVDAFVEAEAGRIRDGADPMMVVRNITDPEVARRVSDAAGDVVIRSAARTPFNGKDVVIESHDRWSIYQERSAQLGDGMVRWVEDPDTAYVTDIQAGAKARGKAMLEWLAKDSGKALYAVGVVEDSAEFWDKMEDADLIQGQTDENFVDYFGLRRSVTRPEFFSQLERAVAAVPDRLATMAAPQWKLWLDANAPKLGVKKDEIEWSGIADFLQLAGAKKIERGELAALASKNAPRAAGLAMYANGATSDEVASQIGVSPTTVLRWVKWAGITRSPSETKGVTREKRAEAIRLYKAGDSVASVSEKTGLGTSTVHRIVVVDGSNRSLAEVAGAGEDAKNDAIALYILGLNTYEAAEQVGVSQPTVAGWVRDAGVSRGYSGAQSLRSALDRNESTRGIKGRFTSQKGGGEMFAASVYELARMHQLEADDGIATFTRSQDRIPYGDGRNYNPDLEVTNVDGEVFVEEVKPLTRLREQDVRDKAVAAMDFYRDSDKKYRVITERSIGQAGFDAIGPNDYPAEDEARVKAALATARWSAREAGTEPVWDLEAPVFSKGRTASGADWESPSASKFDDLVYKFQDKQIDTKRVVEAIKEASGSLRDDLNVYLNEELYHGRAAKRTEDFVNMELNPLIEDMAKAGMTIADLEEFLHARHAKEANAVIARRNPGEPGLQDGGSGMTNAEADNYMATLPAADRQKLEAAAAKVDAIIAGTRKMFVDYELESQATVDAWDGMFKHYVPLQREDKEGSPGLGQGFSIKGKETKGRTGSTRKVVDILANIAMQRERAIVRGEKNRVAQSLVGLVRANENPDFWLVDEVPTERVFNPNTGLVEDRVDPLYKSRDNAVVAKIKDPSGAVREHAVLFNEEDPRALRMAQALKNLDAAQLNGLLGVSAKITRYFAAVNTQYNPVFGVVNLVRDVQGAMLNLNSTPLKDDKAKIAKYTASALAGIYGDMRAARKGQNPSSQWARLWDEFQEVGGQTGYRDLFATSADRAQAIQKALDPNAWMDSKLGKVFTAGGALKVPLAQAQKQAGFLFDWLSDYNNAMENGVRLAAYKAGLERGLSKQQAASAAKNLTTNFNRKGQAAQQAGAMYAFFNAAIQGTARIGQTLFDMEPGKPKTLRLSSAGKKIVYGGIMLGSIQALALAAAGFSEEDPPEFARERSLIIPTGNKTYVSIPMPLGFHVIPSIGRVATEFVLSGFQDPIKRGIGMTAMFADAFNPIGNAGMSMQTLAPTALDPLVALTENKDWTGRPIARTSSNKAIPGHTLGRDTATSVSEVLSEAINTLSGGNKYVAGAFSPTPDQIDYLLGQLTGGVGREYSKTEQTLKSVVRGESLPTYKIPLVGRFVGNAKGQASEGSAFYANAERLNKIETEAKGLRADGKQEEARDLLAKHPEAYLIAQANTAERQVQKLRRQKSELVKAGAPREQVKAVEEEITKVMARLNRAVEGLKKPAEATE